MERTRKKYLREFQPLPVRRSRRIFTNRFLLNQKRDKLSAVNFHRRRRADGDDRKNHAIPQYGELRGMLPVSRKQPATGVQPPKSAKAVTAERDRHFPVFAAARIGHSALERGRYRVDVFGGDIGFRRLPGLILPRRNGNPVPRKKPWFPLLCRSSRNRNRREQPRQHQ